jgi:drug/metabolite transporter (DMT)-like permease
MEKLQMRKVTCQAKVLGTVLTVAGAMLMTLYKGPLMQLAWTTNRHASSSRAAAEAPAAAAAEISGRDWFLGSVFVIVATLAWASLFVLQTHTIKQYSAQLSLTTLVCFVGTLQAVVVTFAMERRASVWTIGFDMNLLAAAYAVRDPIRYTYDRCSMLTVAWSGLATLIALADDCDSVPFQGIVTSSIAYYVQGLVIQKTGPVFASAFSPLMMIIVAVMGSFILSEKIYLGAVLGAVIIVAGLYSVLWGKEKETREKEADAKTALPMAVVASSSSSDDDDDGAAGIAAAGVVGDGAAGCNVGNDGVRSSSGVRGAAASTV